MYLTPGAGPLAHTRGELDENIRRGFVDDPIHRVQAQSVETVLLEPIERVVNEEVAHGAALRAVVVDGRAPRRVMRGVEELRSVGVKIVAFGPEVVVHDVEKNHQRT